VVTGIYPARERGEDYPGVTGLLVAEAAADHGAPVAWLPTLDEAHAFVAPRLRPGDLVLTLGAGDVDELGHRLLA
jgi:UDP-N-acetylmuramate--alanine ligase